MKQDYANVRLFRATYWLLKEEAVKRRIPMSQLLDEAIKREIKTSRKSN